MAVDLKVVKQGDVTVEEIEDLDEPATLADAIRVLEQHGDLRPNGWVPNPDVGPLLLVTLIQGPLQLLDSGSQWVVADALYTLQRYRGVKAVSRATGMPFTDAGARALTGDEKATAEDVAMDPEYPDIQPFSVDQVEAFGYDEAEDRTGKARQTLYNWTGVAKMFPPASRFMSGEKEGELNPARPLWDGICRDKAAFKGAMLSHFAELKHADLHNTEEDRAKVEGWLEEAAKGRMSVAALKLAVNKYRLERDGEEGEGEGDGEGKPQNKDSIAYQVALRRHKVALARLLQMKVVDLSEPDAMDAAGTVIWWIYHQADKMMLRGGLKREGSEEGGPNGRLEEE